MERENKRSERKNEDEDLEGESSPEAEEDRSAGRNFWRPGRTRRQPPCGLR